MKRLIYITLILSIYGVSYATELSTKAAALSSGEWAQLSTTGLNQSILTDTSGGCILEYSHKAVWDSTNNKWHFVGMGHNVVYGTGKMLTYTDSTDTWSSSSVPSGLQQNHGYYHIGVNTGNGYVYHRSNNAYEPEIYEYNGSSWSLLSDPNLGNYSATVADAMEFFPDLGTSGTIVYSGQYGVHLYDVNGDSWSDFDYVPSSMSYHSWSEYLPSHECVVFGGGNGSSVVYKIDSNGDYTTLTSAPYNMGIYASVTAPDPVGGDLLVWFNNGKFYSFNPTTDTWSYHGEPTHPFDLDSGHQPTNLGTIIAAPIDDYGVVMFIGGASSDWSSPEAWIYKHTGSGTTDRWVDTLGSCGSETPCYTTIAAANSAASAGDTIHIDGGTSSQKVYTNDIFTVSLDHITFSSYGTYLPKINITQNIPNNKGAIIIDADDITLSINGLEIAGAVDSEGDGAAVYIEGGTTGRSIALSDLYIHDGQNGILGSNDENLTISIANCRFEENGIMAGGSQTHNVYIGRVDTLYFDSNYSYSPQEDGHCIKSRAKNSYIRYNRLIIGTGTYGVDLPDGGIAYVIGNVIHQDDNTAGQWGMVTHAVEARYWTNNELYLINNTLHNEWTGGGSNWFTSVHTDTSTFVSKNNIFYGTGTTYGSKSPTTASNNLDVEVDPGFTNASSKDYTLTTSASGAINQGTDPGTANGYDLEPLYHPADTSAESEARTDSGTIDIGAYGLAYQSPAVRNVELHNCVIK